VGVAELAPNPLRAAGIPALGAGVACEPGLADVNGKHRLMTTYRRRSVLASALLVAAFGTATVFAQSKKLPTAEEERQFRQERDATEKPQLIIEAIGVRAGMAIGEAGAGEGYFTFPLSAAVGDRGTVYANDISDEELRLLQHFAGQFGVLKNIVPVRGEVDDPRFPVANLDMIVVYHSFHDFTKPGEWLVSAVKYLRPGGRLAIIDAYNQDHTDMTVEKVTRHGLAAGLRLLSVTKPTWSVHVFVKDSRDAPPPSR
jgi:SAM-dependent methyltransferase